MKSTYSKTILINPIKEHLHKSQHSRIPIAFDLDGVLLNNTGLAKYVSKLIRTPVNKIFYDVQKGYNQFYFKQMIPRDISDSTISLYVSEWIRTHSLRAPPNPTVIRTINKCIKKEMPYLDLTIITARKEIHLQTTMKWIEQTFPQMNYTFVMTSTHNKPDIVQALGVEIFVDDRYKTIKNLVGKIVFPIIYDAPYNNDAQRSGIRGAYRIKRLAEVENFLMLKREEINKRAD